MLTFFKRIYRPVLIYICSMQIMGFYGVASYSMLERQLALSLITLWSLTTLIWVVPHC